MRAILQRVSQASVTVDSHIVGKIGQGFLVLLGVEETDTEAEAKLLADKAAVLRVFEDENGKLNRSCLDIDGEMLVISNFTLYADCKKGRRPSFVKAAGPDVALPLYETFCEFLLNNGVNRVQKGVFGADMKVSLINDGPVTIILDTKELKRV